MGFSPSRDFVTNFKIKSPVEELETPEELEEPEELKELGTLDRTGSLTASEDKIGLDEPAL